MFYLLCSERIDLGNRDKMTLLQMPNANNNELV